MPAIAAAALLLLSLALAGPAAAQSADTPPSTPVGLDATAYSGTAGAISWLRSSDDRGLVVGYEVVRDGTVLATVDALGYVDTALSPGTVYTYRVTAIDNAGQRSGTASVRLSTPGGASGGGPAAPSGLRAEVYSSLAAEIFWTRPATPGLTYEVRRDGAVLTVSDGTSYFDDELSGGRSYTYEVIAIDRRGRRSTPSRVTLDTLFGSSGSDPAPPASLRAEVYSATVAEIFWERPATPGLTYEVRRNGERLTVTDGTSYFDDQLAAGTSYIYEVTTFDREGRRSTATSVSLETLGDGGPPAGSAPAAPGRLRGEVYSATAAEIFWERAATPGLTYDVVRDGTLLTMTDGTSYFDDQLSAGRSYTYEVSAIDPEGRRSATSTVTLDTTGGVPEEGDPGTGGSGLITSASYEQILRQVVTIANDEVLDDVAAGVTPLFTTLSGLVGEVIANGSASGDGLAFVSRESLGGGAFDDAFTFSCDSGGTLVARAFDDPDRSPVQEVTIDGPCVVDGNGYDGRAFKLVRFARSTDVERYDAFSITRADGSSLTLDGDYADTTPEQRGPRIVFGWTDADYLAEEGGSTTRIEGYTSLRESVVGGPPCCEVGEPLFTVELPDGRRVPVTPIPNQAEADVTFSVTAPWSSDERLDVTVDLALADGSYGFSPRAVGDGGPPPDYPLSDLGSPLVLTDEGTGEQLIIDNLPPPATTQWQTGTLTVTAADGSALALSPETGDPATFSVTIDGETDPIVRRWSEGFQVSCPQPIDCR